MTTLDETSLPETTIEAPPESRTPYTHGESLCWTSLIDRTLREPRALFSQLAQRSHIQTTTLLLSIGIMLTSSVVAALATNVWRNDPLTDATWPVLTTMVGTTTVWWSVVSTLNWVGSAFTGRNRWRCLATLSALSSLPWLFYGPLALVKVAVPTIGPAFAPLFALALWGWQWALFGMAVSFTFGLTPKRTITVLLAPLSLFFVWWIWVGQFFESLFRVVP
ncbi:MAG: Yip1 family protein [Vampirovibrionales bacterium]|nr:Yip1 family protein [Vampirovibrionales bacterium]